MYDKYIALELLSLEKEYEGIRDKYHSVDILTEYTDRKSEMYEPLKRNGLNPRWRHESFQFSCYKPKLIGISNNDLENFNMITIILFCFVGLENTNTIPHWVHDIPGKKPVIKKTQNRELCPRETRWTEPVLRLLHQELCGK